MLTHTHRVHHNIGVEQTKHSERREGLIDLQVAFVGFFKLFIVPQLFFILALVIFG